MISAERVEDARRTPPAARAGWRRGSRSRPRTGPEKNITSEVMNRIIPRIGLLIPRWAWPAGGRVRAPCPAVTAGASAVTWSGPGRRGGLPRAPSAPPRRRAAVAAVADDGRGGRRRPGRSERISGRRSKLYGGGGEDVAHSRVLPSHGSSPAILPLRSEMNTFQMNGSIETRDQEAADRRGEVPVVPAGVARVVGDPPGHALDAEHVHREERQVEADEHQHEVDLAEALVEHPAGHLREPVVDPGEHAEHRAAEQHVVQVGDDPVRVVEREVDRARRR